MARSPTGVAIRRAAARGGARARRRPGAGSAYDRLRGMIVDMTLAPGRELDEAQLVSLLGVSRTPVREALFRLAAEGLVIQVPNRGAHVAPVDLSGLRQYFEALDYLQRAINRLAALRRREDDVRRLREAEKAFESAVAAGDAARINAENRRFHEIIADAAGNPHLRASYCRLLVEGSRIAYLCFCNVASTQPDHLARTAEEHRQMIEAIEEGNAARAESLGHAHAELFRERIVRSLVAGDDTLAGISIAS